MGGEEWGGGGMGEASFWGYGAEKINGKQLFR